MSLKGGYKISDFKDTNLVTGKASTIEGVYDAIESNYRKALLISGIVIDGVEKADCFVSFTISSGNYVSEIYGLTLTITSADAVTVKTKASA